MNLEPKFISLIKSIITKHLFQAEIFIFGSRAKGTNKEFSDIDIAIKSPNLDFTILANIKFDLEESDLPYKVDVVNYDELEEHILSQAVEI
jgi:predicted nucleotidyltransferase